MSVRGLQLLRAGLGLLVVVFVVASCGDARPDAVSWEMAWQDAVALVPKPEALGDDPAELCESALAELRQVGPDLIPSPEESLDTTVRQWLEVAEGTFFECPPDDGGFAAAYEDLHRVEAEVAASLATDG